MKRLFIFCFLILILASGCKTKNESLIIKTGVQPFADFVDPNIHDAFEFLKAASEEFKKVYNKKDLAIKVIQYSAARRKEEITDSFGTDDSPDIIFASQFNQSTYIHSGHLVSLDDIISPDMRSDISGDIWENCLVNNKTFMIPFITMQNVMCFNKKLFRLCGLDRYCIDEDKIQTWTIDEWDEVFSTLAKNLPSNIYPAMMYCGSDEGDTHIMMLLRSRGANIFTTDGKMDFREALPVFRWIREGASKEFFPPHPELLTIADNSELFFSGQLALYIENAALERYADEAGIERGYVNFPSTEKNGLVTCFDMSFGVVDNGDKKRLATAKEFIKYIYNSHWLDFSATCIPTSKKTAKKFSKELKSVAKYLNNKARNVNYTYNSANWLGVRAVFYQHIKELFTTNKSVEEIAESLENDCNRALDLGRLKSSVHK